MVAPFLLGQRLTEELQKGQKSSLARFAEPGRPKSNYNNEVAGARLISVARRERETVNDTGSVFMSMRFEGERRFSLPPEQLWPKLRDAAFLVHCIPDATVQGQPERDRAQCSVRPGFSFVRGNMEVTIQ